MSGGDLGDLSMIELFRLEAESQAEVLTSGLLALEREPTDPRQLEACMRASHSLKGAARIVDRNSAVRVAHAMEDCFVAAQQGNLRLGRTTIDALLRSVDLLTRIARAPESEGDPWSAEKKGEVDSALEGLRSSAADEPDEAPVPPLEESPRPEPEGPVESGPDADRVLRVSADNLNRLLALAGESLVESRWLKPFAESLLRLKRLHGELGRAFDELRDAMPVQAKDDRMQATQAAAQSRLHACHQFLTERLTELEMFDLRSANLSQRLYDEVLAVRMRPFSDGVPGFPRMVRDLGRSLGKEVALAIEGGATPVDRDILQRLEAPLGHLLRNAVDHGIETPDERAASGKAPEGRIRIEARHSSGLLQITVEDDGRGIDSGDIRKAVVARKLANAATAEHMSEAELLEFLFLPGFSMKEEITEISGRGVGLDAVQAMVKRVRGAVRIATQPGRGTRFQLQLPLTLSVVRTLLVEIGGEAYAFPLAYVIRTLKVSREAVETVEGRQHCVHGGRQIGLVAAHRVLEGAEGKPSGSEWPVVVLGDPAAPYGLVVDRFIGERELVVQPLEPRLGKVKDVAAAALMEDGSPVLIVDVEDIVRSVEKLIAAGTVGRAKSGGPDKGAKKARRILVVDDSLTVRELERKLLANRGYEVEVAVDGADGWNAVRHGRFDLVVTDVDMPRMDGIELVTLMRKDPAAKSIPIMIVSYKDRPEDRRRGLESGADFYLAKAGFHDDALLKAVADLIGEPRRVKIGIVNDLALSVEALRRAIELAPKHEVIWTADSGAEAVRLCGQSPPDLVLMDLIMPGMDGVEATRRIMAETPCAILVVTASVGANVWRVYEAMGHGALDAVDTPALGIGDLRVGAEPLLRKIDTIRRLIVDRKDAPSGAAPAALVHPAPRERALVAIGASAGGPVAVAAVLKGLPKGFPAAVVIVQHVDVQFAGGMAEWLNRQSSLPVRLAKDGDTPIPGEALLAGTNDHLILMAARRLTYTPEPADYPYRPSVDVFFQSVCRHWRGEAAGVLLTGMGRDGAAGLKAMRMRGCYTIAQDQATSAVYGMPKAAARLDAAVEIQPLDRIAARLAARFSLNDG